MTMSRLLTTLEEKTFEHIVEHGEKAGKQHSFPFPTVFSTLPQTEIIIKHHLICRLQML